jgi:hypothetical protein
VKDSSSPVARFERAVDAVVTGDAASLGRALREHPELVRTRSTRTHRSMLLHYVGANGVESWRQRTPGNAVQILEMLVAAGAEIDATADIYGGGSTTLGLVATSCHPRGAGLQEPLIDHALTGRSTRRATHARVRMVTPVFMPTRRSESARAKDPEFWFSHRRSRRYARLKNLPLTLWRLLQMAIPQDVANEVEPSNPVAESS